MTKIIPSKSKKDLFSSQTSAIITVTLGGKLTIMTNHTVIAVTFQISQKSCYGTAQATVKVEDILDFTNTYNCQAQMAIVERPDGTRYETFAKSWYSGKSWRNADFMVMGIDGYKLHPTVRISGLYGHGTYWSNPKISV